ncbi:MAG: threonine synthase [Deltaproteobacteria bacterium]|nr:MAG: threonine synthase [Deltaproteobacteria bacterium]
MKIDDFPEEMKDYLLPSHVAQMAYQCIGCGESYPLDRFLYTCPRCGGLLRIIDLNFDALKRIPGLLWQKIFDYRKMLNLDGLKGIFLFHELILPIVPLADVIYLGEGHTPMVKANEELSRWVGVDFYLKYDGLNPSASFKDRGMASAISFINYMIKAKGIEKLVGVCASTGDTSAAAALYLSYLSKEVVHSVVLLPRGKVTSAQLSQPLGSGATVIEIPGVFDDCMRIVERLAEEYEVCLLNSKNPVRIQGQKSYSYEVAQQLDFKTRDLVVVVPIGNAGNVTAVMEGFVDLYDLGIIEGLPMILGIQSVHANPIVLWRHSGEYRPVEVRPSVAQAAMIGNPVSFPKVSRLVEEYFKERFMAIQVTEQEIIEGMLITNRHGHVVCTQGGESIVGLKKGVEMGLVRSDHKVVVDSTSHQLKFAGFQQMYFDDSLPEEYEIRPRKELKNRPVPLEASAEAIAQYLGLEKRKGDEARRNR